MRREAGRGHRLRAVAAILGLALTAAGCGSSSQATLSSTPPTTATGSRHPVHLPNITVLLTSKAVPHPGGPISARYTCDGTNASPAFHWSKVPAGTREIAVFVLNYAYVNNKPVVDWAVAGINPKLRSLDSGKLPQGAVVGRNRLGHTGYSLCPPRGVNEQYAALVLAIPRRLKGKAGFDSVAFRERIEHVASVEGLLSFTYKRA